MKTEFRTTREFMNYVWPTLSEDDKHRTVAAMKAEYGTNYNSPDVFWNYSKDRGIIDALGITIVPQEYSELDPQIMWENATWDRFGEIISEEVTAIADLISDPLGTAEIGWDIATGLTRQGKGHRDLPGMKEKRALADAVVEQARYQASPQGISADPLRSAVTAAQVAPTGPLRSAAAATKVPRMVKKLAGTAHTASQVAGLDFGFLTGNTARGFVRTADILRREIPSKWEDLTNKGIPLETVGRGAENVPSHSIEMFGQPISMMGGSPPRTIAETLNISNDPVVENGVVKNIKVGDRIKEFQKLTSPERIDRLILRVNSGADQLQKSASQHYNKGLAAMGDKLDEFTDKHTYHEVKEAIEERLVDLGFDITHVVELPDPPKDVPKPKNPIHPLKVDLEKGPLSEFLKDRTSKVEEFLRKILNFNTTTWGMETPVTLRDVYKMRREVDLLIDSFTPEDKMTRDARVAYNNLRTVLQEELGRLLGPDYNKVMRDYEQHRIVMSDLSEAFGVQPGQVVGSGTEFARPREGVRTGVYNKLVQTLGNTDMARYNLDLLKDLERMTGSNDVVPMLIASVASPIVANNLVARHAMYGALGVGMFEGAMTGDSFPTAGMAVGGALGAISSMLMMNPRFLTKMAAGHPRFGEWLSKNEGKLNKFMGADYENGLKVWRILKDSAKYGWDVGRLINQLEENIPKEKKTTIHEALSRAARGTPTSRSDIDNLNIEAYSATGTY